MPYATKDQLFLLALAAPAFVAYARPFDAVDPITATIRLKAHGFSASDIITFEVADGGFLPVEFDPFAVYSPVPLSADLFRVAGVSSLANPGNGWAVAVDPYRRLDMHLAEVSAFIDEHLTAHEPPIQVDTITGLYPWVLVGVTARIAARRAIASLESMNPEYRVAIDRLLASEESDNELLKAWKAGKPIQPRPTDETSIPENVIRARSGRAAQDWNSGTF